MNTLYILYHQRWIESPSTLTLSLLSAPLSSNHGLVHGAVRHVHTALHSRQQAHHHPAPHTQQHPGQAVGRPSARPRVQSHRQRVAAAVFARGAHRSRQSGECLLPCGQWLEHVSPECARVLRFVHAPYFVCKLGDAQLAHGRRVLLAGHEAEIVRWGNDVTSSLANDVHNVGLLNVHTCNFYTPLNSSWF